MAKRPHEMTPARKAALAKANAERQRQAAAKDAVRRGGTPPKVVEQQTAPPAADDESPMPPIVPHPAERRSADPMGDTPADVGASATADPPTPAPKSADVGDGAHESPAPAGTSLLGRAWHAFLNFGDDA